MAPRELCWVQVSERKETCGVGALLFDGGVLRWKGFFYILLFTYALGGF